jgi:predicted MFS family arabinose efflux permease
MDQHDKKMLQDTLRIERENHVMLKKLLSIQRRAFVFKAIYWVIIIGAAIGIFSFLKPYLESVASFYTGSSSGVSNAIHLIGGE